MGYTTDFVGHVDIDPALNEDEINYLTAFSASRRFDRAGGPYAVPGNPAAEQRGETAIEAYNRSAPGQPGLWCQWTPCWDGCCLAFDGTEKFYSPVRWMSYLIEHFLKPGAQASRSDDPQFAGFTFDHVLDGMIVGCRRDNKELYSITVTNNRVRETVLRPSDTRYLDYPPLPYESAIDRQRADRARRRRGTQRPDGIADLASPRSG
ncbi:hypothetical protein [Nocardioides speluncae]|uniref:hypothetical protein n=1 Tax=Nocardioides speluncae TaxID=2670337 RepID=UPI000D69AF2E|nr:hypothetical protein [Nocardioides speluncae]